MLIRITAHAGAPIAPHDLWAAWSFEPLVVGSLILLGWAFHRGATAGAPSARRRGAFWASMAAIVLAVISPLDALSSSLASAHMVQHVLLMLVAAPLLAYAAPGSAVLRGTPPVVRRAAGDARRRLKLTHSRLRMARNPVNVWLLHVGTIWIWHAAVLYDAAVRNMFVHALEHTMFLATGVLFWRVVVGARTAAAGAQGAGIALVFTMALQSVFLALLLTFAAAPWYAVYDGTTAAWGLDQLADQQLAGAIMWVPAGFVYVIAGLLLLSAWIRHSDEAPTRRTSAGSI